MSAHPHLEGLIPVAVEAFLASTGQAHAVTQLQRDLTTTCMRAALEAVLANWRKVTEADAIRAARIICDDAADRADVDRDKAWAMARERYIEVARQALAALPGGGVALSEAQCDAIYDALDSWASDLDAYELGLPRYAGGGKEAGRDVIREALTPTPNPHEADRNG